MLTLLGIALGLATAGGSSAAYLFSRIYVVGRPKAVIPLLVQSHLVMGIISLALVGVVWREQMPPVRTYIGPVLALSGFYITAQTALLLLLRSADASRISPLLGLKVPMLAGINAILLQQFPNGCEYLGVSLAAAAAVILSLSGGRLPWRQMGGILAICLLYAASDQSIRASIRAMAPVHWAWASVTTLCLSYIACGLVAGAMAPIVGVGRLGDWKRCLPYSLTWYASMATLFACFAAVGVVLGGILQALRGPISVLAGTVLARRGMVHVETPLARHVLAKRIVATVLMVAAVAAYACGSSARAKAQSPGRSLHGNQAAAMYCPSPDLAKAKGSRQ